MSKQQITSSIIQILKPDQETVVGAGFILSETMAVTCAHVIDAASSRPGQIVDIRFYETGRKMQVRVKRKGWSPRKRGHDDVAFLELTALPEGIVPVVLGTAENRRGHDYEAFGFTPIRQAELQKANRWADDKIAGVVDHLAGFKRPMLELGGQKIRGGMSGTPVLDTVANRVVGMVSEAWDDGPERPHETTASRLAWATTADTLLTLQPDLQLWPDAYGPDEKERYLDFLLSESKKLRLPGSDEPIELERIYVSLRGDAMNAAERQAEYDQLERQVTAAAANDVYSQHSVRSQVLMQDAIMKMLTARDWQMQFGERDKTVYSLAEVVERHPQVVLLGGPGTGKSTLCQWLTLQFATALQNGAEQVRVPADRVRPQADAAQLLDLGVARLPILIRMAHYAAQRFQGAGVEGDVGLTLQKFIERGLFHKEPRLHNAGEGLTAVAVGQLAADFMAVGKALVILDGLDEVTDFWQRPQVIEAVDSFIEAQGKVGNRLLLTSRIVGYKVKPLTHLPHYTVEAMDEAAIGALAGAWLRHKAALPSEEVETATAQLVAAVFEHGHAGVRDMAGNPLLLTILTQVYWEQPEKRLPGRRTALFAAAEAAFYKQREGYWQASRIGREKLGQALAVVAFDIHRYESSSYAQESEVRHALRTVFADPDQVSAVLRAARQASGFLVERGEGVYGFLHRGLQEYFAAKHLLEGKSRAEEVVAVVQPWLLEPTWYEPVLLAFGLVSERFSGGRTPDPLAALFMALLRLDDPAAPILPRRALLAAAAVNECVRLPEVAVRQMAEELLAHYAQRERYGRSPVRRRRIELSFRQLQRSEGRGVAGAVLCAGLRDEAFGQRLAATEIIIATEWDSAAVAQALIEAYSRYAGPAGTLLTALQALWQRQPQLWAQLGVAVLPMRAALQDGAIWQRVTALPEGVALLQVLYLPVGAELAPDNINRDSALTPHLLACWQPDMVLFPALWLARLRPLLSLPSSEGRDAALALMALGDVGWLQDLQATAGGQEGKAWRPLLAASNFLLALALALDLALARDSDFWQEILDLLQQARERWADDPEMLALLMTAAESARQGQSYGGTLAPFYRSWKILVEAVTAWAQQPLAKTGELEGLALSEVNLPLFVADLESQDDQRRQAARELLGTSRPASDLSPALIEQIARQADQHESAYQVGTQLSWCLNRLKHDEPGWIEQWLAAAAASEANPALTILGHINDLTAEVWQVILAALPQAPGHVRKALFESISRVARLNDKALTNVDALLALLPQLSETAERIALLKALGCWPQAHSVVGEALLAYTPTHETEWAAYFQTLAQLTAKEAFLQESVLTLLCGATHEAAKAALVRLHLLQAKDNQTEGFSQQVAADLPDMKSRFQALVQAGVDDDGWAERYHVVLVQAARTLLLAHESQLLPLLLARCERMAQAEWQVRRLLLALLAAVIEVMPRAVEKRAAERGLDLEALLVTSATDMQSFTARRSALTALSYLPQASAVALPVLLAGCRDIEVVQADAIEAARRWPRVQGEWLPRLAEALAGESGGTAYGAAQLLGALGTKATGTAADWRDEIMRLLVAALQDERSRAEVFVLNRSHDGKEKLESKGPLEDTLYEVLLQVAGLPG